MAIKMNYKVRKNLKDSYKIEFRNKYKKEWKKRIDLTLMLKILKN